MAKIYLKYRMSSYNQGNGLYSLSYHFNQERAWYVQNAGVNIKDCLIPDDKYIDASRGRKFGIIEFNEEVISETDIKYDLELYKQCATVILTAEQAKDFLRDNTNLTELESGVFEISPATELGPQVTLNLN